MLSLIQRVTSASVVVDGEALGKPAGKMPWAIAYRVRPATS